MATPKQMKISSFLTSSADKKRKGKEKETGNHPPKKLKLDDDEREAVKENSPTPSSPVAAENSSESAKNEATAEPAPELSPEVKAKMAQNKMAAKLKLLATKTSGLVTNFGPSWLPALEAEFGKDYFLKLSQFVASGG